MSASPRIVGIIPARMGSSRFPGKPLAPLCGRTLVEHVYWRTSLSRSLSQVYVATCDTEIAEAMRASGAAVVMTSPDHQRASDRVAEALDHVDADIVVMIQGDEPMIVPEMVDLAVAPLLSDPEVVCTNLVSPIASVEDFRDPNTIKVMIGSRGDALYMTRVPAPTQPRGVFTPGTAFKQVCVIPFRAAFLRRYTALSPTPLEQLESIDMLRAMEHGIPIRMVPSPFVTQAVDTPEDLARVEALMAGDALMARYGEAAAR